MLSILLSKRKSSHSHTPQFPHERITLLGPRKLSSIECTDNCSNIDIVAGKMRFGGYISVVHAKSNITFIWKMIADAHHLSKFNSSL